MTDRRPLHLTSSISGLFGRGILAVFFSSLFILCLNPAHLHAGGDSPENLQNLARFFEAHGHQSLNGLQNTVTGPSASEAAAAAKEAFKEGAEGAYPSTASFDSIAEAIGAIEGLSDADSETMSAEIDVLFSKLVQHGRTEEVRLGAQAFNEALMNNTVNIKNSAGQAELNVVDGAKFQRILHGDSELSFSFIPIDKVPIDSKHEARIIASQHLTAGKSRKDGQVGRDSVNVYYRWKPDGSLEIVKIKFFQRHANWTKAWWRDQLLVSLYKPTLSDLFVSGLFWGGVQLGLTGLIQYLSDVWAHVPQTPHVGQIVWTGCFGAACGVFATSIRKFNSIGGRLEALVRNSLTTTIPFLIPFTLLDPHRQFDSITKVALFLFLEIPIFCFLSNISKIPLQRMVADRSRMRLNTENLQTPDQKKSVLRKGSWFGVKQGNWEYQSLYNFVLFPLRIYFLKSTGGFKLKEQLGFNLGWNKLSLPLLYPLFWQAQVAYAADIGVDDADKQRREFEKSTVGVTTGLVLGSLKDIVFIPAWAARRFVWGDTVTAPKDYKPLQRLIARWKLQIHGPTYHLGRVIEATGTLLDTEAIAQEPVIQHRFERVQKTQFPAEPPALLTSARKALLQKISSSFHSLKLKIDAASKGSLGSCAENLRLAGRKWKRPFLERLKTYQLP